MQMNGDSMSLSQILNFKELGQRKLFEKGKEAGFSHFIKNQEVYRPKTKTWDEVYK